MDNQRGIAQITYIISNINKALAFEWIATSINKEKFNLNFILLNSGDSELERFLLSHNIKVTRVKYTSKKDIPLAIFLTYKLLKENKTTIVHTHLFDANLVGLITAWFAGIKRRIHTRHHSNYHHLYYPKAIKYDKFVNWLSTDIIAISEVVKNILLKKENVSCKKIRLINHGFQLEDFNKVSEESIKVQKQKYLALNSYPVVGVVSRYTEWKGVQFIIPAFEQLLLKYPNAMLLLANANGDYKDEIQKLLQTIPARNYVEIPFESDIFSLYKLVDVFIHVPISSEVEAFGQTYVEALAAGIPSIFTLSGVANEFIIDKHNAVIVPYNNSEAIYQAILELTDNKTLAGIIKMNGEMDVKERFNLNKMITSLEQLYEEKNTF